MFNHFADRLLAAIEAKGCPICVGIDPVVDRLPAEILDRFGLACSTDHAAGEIEDAAAAAAFRDYAAGVLAAVAPIAPLVKINIAFFERFRAEGVRAYHAVVRLARDAGVLVIGDVKRADIGHTSLAYAEGALRETDSVAAPDAVTINPYFGYDSIAPFIDVARRSGRGVFVLVQTSNESAHEIQDLQLVGGGTVADRIAGLVHDWSSRDGLIGERGYSCVGAVVSPRDLASTARLRKAMPHSIFLVPGFGAQGRSAQEVATCFRGDGTGAIVNASRSVGFAFCDPRYAGRFGDDWAKCIAAACTDFKREVNAALDGVPAHTAVP